MKSRDQNWQFWVAGMVSAILLVTISMFAFRADVAKDAAMVACVNDVLLQSFFGLACLWTLKSSGLAVNMPEFVDHGSPSLRSLGLVAPWLVLMQVAMGAALRYKLMGAISHVLGAMLVGVFLLYYATGVMAPAPAGHLSRTSSVLLLWMVLLQVIFGIAAYVVRFGQGENNGLPDTRIFSIAHIVTGALTLATTIVLSDLVRRASKKQEVAGLPSTGAV